MAYQRRAGVGIRAALVGQPATAKHGGTQAKRAGLTMRTSYQQARLDGMAQGFGVDVEPAQHLSGPELDCWLDAAEDELFAAALAELATMRTERLTWQLAGAGHRASCASTGWAPDTTRTREAHHMPLSVSTLPG